MNNPNPFVPKGSLLEQQSQSRSRLKLIVFCTLAVSVTGLVAMLIQGCKREQPSDNGNADNGLPTNPPAFTDASNMPPADTNFPPMVPTSGSNAPTAFVPPAPAPMPAPAPAPEAAGTEYIVKAGDTLAKIAKSNHVSLKDLQAANPGVDARHLKVKQKLIIPASAAPAATSMAASPAPAAADASGETYVVKSGDTLTSIAKKHGTKVKDLMAANNLTTTKIKVGQKLKLPGSATAAAPTDASASAPAMAPAPAPAPMSAPPMSPAPATTPAPAPAH